MKLCFKLRIPVCIGSFEFRDFVLKKSDLGGVILFQGLDFNKLFGSLLFFGVLKLSFHVVGSSCHKVFKFVFFLLESDFRNLLFVEKIVAFKTEGFTLLDFIFEHKFKFLDVCFVEFCAFGPFLFEKLDFDFEASVNFTELGGFKGVSFLELD